MRLKFYSKKAFTLAEALITFAILGVIAAMTIPGMILSMQKSEYVSGMKKSYTTLTNAVKKMNFANDMAEYKKFWSDETVFWNEFASQMRIMQICGNGESGCFTKDPIKKLNGSDAGIFNGKNYTLRTADGYCYQYTPGSAESSTYGISAQDSSKSIGVFAVDVNGDGRPNKIGHDLFFFVYVEDKGVIPAGFYDHSNCNKNNSGYSCAGRLLKEGKINY